MRWLLRMSISAAVQVCQRCVCVCVCVCMCVCVRVCALENVYQRRGTSVSKMSSEILNKSLYCHFHIANVVMRWPLRMSISAAVQVCQRCSWRYSEKITILSFSQYKCSDALTFENVYQRRGTSVSKMLRSWWACRRCHSRIRWHVTHSEAWRCCSVLQCVCVHIYMYFKYIYIYICVCVCVCVWYAVALESGGTLPILRRDVVAAWSSVLRRVAVCFSVLQCLMCVGVDIYIYYMYIYIYACVCVCVWNMLLLSNQVSHYPFGYETLLKCCSVLQRVAACCNVLCVCIYIYI